MSAAAATKCAHSVCSEVARAVSALQVYHSVVLDGGHNMLAIGLFIPDRAGPRANGEVREGCKEVIGRRTGRPAKNSGDLSDATE